MQRPSADDTPKLDNSHPLFPPPLTPRHSRSRTTLDFSRASSPSRSSTYLPFWSSRASSPQRPASPTESDATFHTVAETQDKRPGVKRLTSWFEGSSEPVNIGLVASASSEDIPSRPIMSSANTSRFSFFRKSTTNLSQYSESLESLNIKETLFPDGPAEFSPAAYKNLQQNAEGALKLFQQAYREGQIQVRKVSSERNVLADELEAAQMRNEHLKAQLLDLAERGSEQEKTIQKLQAENDRLHEVHSRTIRLITDDESMHGRSGASSRESITSASTDVSSIFSQQEVGELVDMRRVVDMTESPIVKHASPHLQQVMSVGSNSHLNSMRGDVECVKCRGGNDEAWEVLNIKVAENTALKQYIQEMEDASEDAGNLCVWKPIELMDIKRRCGELVGGREGLKMLDDGVEAEEERRMSGMKGCIV